MRTVAAALMLLLVTLAIYVLRLNRAAGLMVDDAWYLLLAKSLTDGTGYSLISSAIEPILPLYPPGLPAMLDLRDFRAGFEVWSRTRAASFLARR